MMSGRDYMVDCTLTAKAAVKQLPGVDLVKFVMAFCVVAIHVRPNYSLDWEYPLLFGWFINLGVPFFFISSGYLLQRKFEGHTAAECSRIARSRALKVLRLWCCWLLIALPLTIYHYTYHYISPVAAFKTYVYELLLCGMAEPRAYVLWFLYSMMWVCLILSFAVRIKHYRPVLLTLFLGILFLNWCANEFQTSLLLHFKQLTKNTLGGGAFMVAGMMLYQYRRAITGGVLC